VNANANAPGPDGLEPVDQRDLIARLSEPGPVTLTAADFCALWRVLDRVAQTARATGVCPVCGFSIVCAADCARHVATDVLLGAALAIRGRRRSGSLRN
jgi:hypothetical protein